MNAILSREHFQKPEERPRSRTGEFFAPLTLSSHEILRGRRKITINHEGVEYTLHLTRQNKLLLTK